MNVKKFSAKTSREAWRMVREALGPDAVILSNRNVNGLVEILALAGDDVASLSEPMREQAPMPASEPEPELEPDPFMEARPAPRTAARAAAPMAAQMHQPMNHPMAGANLNAPNMPSFAEPRRSMEGAQASGLAEALEAARGAQQSFAARHGDMERQPMNAMNAVSGTGELADVMHEIRAMRGMLESQLAEIAWGSTQKREPAKATILREMLAAGFSASLARYLIEKLPAAEQADGGMHWIKSILARNLTVMSNESELLEKGGVYALVGPTGVGKTTTTAKLAARCVMRHGAGKLALITTDGYRIGGYEQLRIYGKILGVMVHSVKDETDLRIALEEMKNKHTVLIDTVGMSQRDKMVAEQVAMLSGAGTRVKRLLCLSATSTAETLNEVVRSYRGDGLAGCIMTKLDEAATVGGVLDVAIRQKLNLYYVANGQRVPEDLHVPNQNYLVDRAFKLKRETAPFQLQDDELPLVMANTTHAMHDRSLREVSLG